MSEKRIQEEVGRKRTTYTHHTRKPIYYFWNNSVSQPKESFKKMNGLPIYSFQPESPNTKSKYPIDYGIQPLFFFFLI